MFCKVTLTFDQFLFGIKLNVCYIYDKKQTLSDPQSGLNTDVYKQHRQVLKTQCVTSTDMEQKMHMYAISDIKPLKINEETSVAFPLANNKK